MNYRHAFHAGNFADCLKHLVLTLCLTHLKKKRDKPLCYIDTHAGTGMYDLTGEAARRSPEWREGIARLLSADISPEPLRVLAPFLDVVRTMQAGQGAPTVYPGSPEIAARLLGERDRMQLFELHGDDCAALDRHFAKDRRVRVERRDGYKGLASVLPPKEKRGLVLVDPPFEDRDEMAHMAAAAVEAIPRFETGTYIFWRPLKDLWAAERFDVGLGEWCLSEREMLPEKLLRADLWVAEPGGEGKLAGAGVVGLAVVAAAGSALAWRYRETLGRGTVAGLTPVLQWLLGLVPGLPFLPFLILAGGGAGLAYGMDQQQKAEAAQKATRQAFYAEMDQGQIQHLDVTPNCSILAVIGERMSGTPGVAATFFGALGDAGVNVRAIAQGSSERNISAVVDGSDAQRALRAVHAGFYLSKRTLSIGVIGAGNVGAALLDQINDQVERLREEQDIDFRVRGVTTTKSMLRAEQSVDLDNWREALENGEPADLDAFVDHVQTDYHPHTVLVDCTASDQVARHYQEWLERGIHVVTPNKRANTRDQVFYERVQRAAHRQQVPYLYETTVGAGLPVISTLRDLVRAGDRVDRIEGVLSGTLAFIFNSLAQGMPFSEAVRNARDRGYTEPDPRDDLKGEDVARKLLILAREMGLQVERDDVSVESLVPAHLFDVSVDEFMEQLPSLDDEWKDRQKRVEDGGGRLQYIGLIEDGRLSVRTREIGADSPFAHLRGTDNMVVYTTARYSENPLVVQGPGAGPEVTAAGVFADLLRVPS